MAVDGIGTRCSPIFIHDSEEEPIQELTYQQFYGSSSEAGKHDATHHSTHQDFTMPGKRKSRDEEELVPDTGNNHLPPSTSLENRLSQPESKKARKRRRKAEREALERKKVLVTDWSNNPPAASSSQPEASLSTQLDAERQYSSATLRLENEANLMFCEYGPPSRSPPPSSTFESDWVSSMVIAGEFPRCKKVKTSTATNVSPRTTPKPSPTFPPSNPSSDFLPPIHIHSDLGVSTEAPTPTPLPPQPAPQITGLPHNIGMKPEQDPNGIHGIFQITAETKEGGAGMQKRKIPYVPNPARTLVMEQLPKTHRTINFVDNWCRSACGIPPLHLFVDPPSANALIEFPSADLAKKAWASPRLGQHLLGTKSHLLKGKAREDLIKIWWYRVDSGKGAGVSELEEGEIEEVGVGLNKMQVVSEQPRKESKKERKTRLWKERKLQGIQQQQRQVETLAPTPSQPALPVITSTPAQVQATSSPVHMPPTGVLPPIMSSPLYPAQPWPQPLTNTYYPIPSSSRTTVGSSLAPGARGGHDDSASIASSGRRSPADYKLSGKTAVVASTLFKSVVVATTIGQADDLADYSVMDMDVDVEMATSAPSSTWKKPTSLDVIPSQGHSTRPSIKDNSLPPKPLISNPNTISGKPAESRSNQPSRAQLQSQSQTPRPSLVLISNHPPNQVQRSSPASLSSPSLTPVSCVSNSSQRTSVTSIPARSFPLPPIQASNASNSPVSFEPKVTTNDVHCEGSMGAASVGNKLDPRGKMESATEGPLASTHSKPALTPVSTVATSVTPSSSSGNSMGQLMEENLRQLVFASKRARFPGVQPLSPSSQFRSSISADVNMAPFPQNFTGIVLPSDDTPKAEGNDKVVDPNTVGTSVCAPSSATIPSASSSTTLNQLTVDPFSFEDLAVTFITETIETVKANNQQPPVPQSLVSSSGAGLTSTPPSTTSTASPIVGLSTLPTSSKASAGGVIPDTLPLSTNSSVKLTKSELSAIQRRLERHLQESKSLMERISTAKTKREKDLLLKIMSEKMRLFEEENKTSEKKITKLAYPGSTTKKKPTQTQTTAVFQFQQWPTTSFSSILVLSDDED